MHNIFERDSISVLSENWALPVSFTVAPHCIHQDRQEEGSYKDGGMILACTKQINWRRDSCFQLNQDKTTT